MKPPCAGSLGGRDGAMYEGVCETFKVQYPEGLCVYVCVCAGMCVCVCVCLSLLCWAVPCLEIFQKP